MPIPPNVMVPRIAVGGLQSLRIRSQTSEALDVKNLIDSNRMVWTLVAVWVTVFVASPCMVSAQEKSTSSSRRDVAATDDIKFPNSDDRQDSLLSQMTGEPSEERSNRYSEREPAVERKSIREFPTRKPERKNDFQATNKSNDALQTVKRPRQYPLYKSQVVQEQTVGNNRLSQRSQQSSRTAGKRRTSQTSSGGIQNTAVSRNNRMAPTIPANQQRSILQTPGNESIEEMKLANTGQAVSVLESRQVPPQELVARREQISTDVPTPEHKQESEVPLAAPSFDEEDLLFAFESHDTPDQQSRTEPLPRPVPADAEYRQVARKPSDVLLNKTQENLKRELRSRHATNHRMAESRRQENVFNSRLENLARRQQTKMGAAVNRSSESDIRLHLSDLAEKSPRASMFANAPGYDAHGLAEPSGTFEPEFDASASGPSPSLNLQVVENAQSNAEKTVTTTGPVYVTLSDTQSRTSLGSRQQDGILGSLGDVESESISRSPQKRNSAEGKAGLVSPRDLWLNNKSRYNWSKIKPLAQGTIADDLSEISQLDSTLNAKFRKPQQDAADDGAGLTDDLSESELLNNESDDEGRRNIERNREQYLRDLYTPLSIAPISKALNYVDDKGNSVIKTENQNLHLIGFGGFYDNAIEGDFYRTNHLGQLWYPKCAVWKSPDICYQPLYYEDENLERFGARVPWVQPGVSALHFFASTVLLPYKMGLDPYSECKYVAGFGRPGNRYCYQRERLVWDFKGSSLQALLAAGLVFAIP